MNDEKEIWKDCKNLSGYMVSNLGNIKSKPKTITMKNGVPRSYKSKIMKQGTNNRGYKKIDLKNDNNETKSFLVHRLVAEAFIPNPDNLPTVNHKDGDKSNNRLDNLEWMTYSDQNKHAIETGLREIKTGFKLSEETKEKMRGPRNNINYDYCSKRIAQIDPDTDEVIKIYDSVKEAAEDHGRTYDTIADVARHKNNRKTAAGFKWEYEENLK